MLIINKTIWRIVGLTLLFTGGWCVYFDQKRKKGGEREIKPKSTCRKRRPSRDALQQFFLQEIEKGEFLYMAGDLEGSVEHFVNAVVVCEDPGKLLAVLQHTLPSTFFQLVTLEVRALSV